MPVCYKGHCEYKSGRYGERHVGEGEREKEETNSNCGFLARDCVVVPKVTSVTCRASVQPSNEQIQSNEDIDDGDDQ